MTRRLVVDLQAPRAAWRAPAAAVRAIRDALGAGWEVVPVDAPAPSDSDGGSGSPESLVAARGAEIYLGYGVPAGVLTAAGGTLRWAHSGTAGVGASLPHLRGSGVTLTNSAGVHAEPMADWVVAAIAYFARGLDRMRAAQDAGQWAKDEFADLQVPVREFMSPRSIAGLVGVRGFARLVAGQARRGQPPAGPAGPVPGAGEAEPQRAS